MCGGITPRGCLCRRGWPERLRNAGCRHQRCPLECGCARARRLVQGHVRRREILCDPRLRGPGAGQDDQDWLRQRRADAARRPLRPLGRDQRPRLPRQPQRRARHLPRPERLGRDRNPQVPGRAGHLPLRRRLRGLSRGLRSGQPAGRSGRAELGQHPRHHRQPVPEDGRHLRREPGADRPAAALVRDLAARRGGHHAAVLRWHLQPGRHHRLLGAEEAHPFRRDPGRGVGRQPAAQRPGW